MRIVGLVSAQQKQSRAKRIEGKQYTQVSFGGLASQLFHVRVARAFDPICVWARQCRISLFKKGHLGVNFRLFLF